MDCDCHPHQTAHTDQRSQLKNMTIVLSMDCCFCESSCNFRFSEASSTSSSSFSRSFLSPHPSALFQPFLFWAVGKMDPYFWKLFVVALCLCSCQQQQKEELSSSSSAHETADAETQFIPFSVRWMDGGQRLCSVDVWVTPTLPGTVQAWQRQIHRCYLCLFFCVRSSWAASMTAGSLRGVCWQLDGCCGQHVRTFTWKTNHRLTTVWLHRPKLICEWISAEFSRVKDASVASDLKLSSVNKGKPCKNHTLEHQQHLKWKRNKVHLN